MYSSSQILSFKGWFEENQPINQEVIPIKPTIKYRKRRDLMLKKFSMQKIIEQLSEVVRRKSLVSRTFKYKTYFQLCMFGDGKDYKFFVTILVIAIAVSLVFHIFFKQDVEASFSEIYFPQPDSLPNEVSLHQKYNYTFTVKNHEGKPSTYNYNTTLELFNLYDVTEGLYKCSAQQRRKVFLKWVNSSEANASVILMPENGITGSATYSGIVQGKPSYSEIIFSQSDDYGYIDWPYYTAQFSYENTLGEGSFTTIFHDKDFVKYTFTIFESTNKVEFSYLENGKMMHYTKKIDELKQSNEVTINATNTLKYYINKKLIFNKSVENMTAGQFSFTMNNTYVLLGGLLLYKDSPIQVTKSKDIRDYEIDNSLILEKLDTLRKSSEDSYYLARNTTNDSTQCSESDCNQIKSYLNDPNNIYYFKANYSDINESILLGLFEKQKNTFFPSYSYIQNSSAQKLKWGNYSVKVDFETFTKPNTLLFSFDKNLMVLFHNSDVFFVLTNNSGTDIYRRANYVNIGVNELSLDSRDNFIVAYINQIPIFSLRQNLPLSNIALYTKNTFIVADNIIVTNKGEGCRPVSVSKDCRRTFVIPSDRHVSTSGNQFRITAQPLTLGVGLAVAPFLGAASLFDISGQKNQIVPFQNVSLSQLIEYDIDIDPKLVNKEIPSEMYNFDGRNARLVNQVNYSFSFNFNILEGLGLLESSFFNDDRSKFVKFMLYQPRNQVYLFRSSEGSLLKNTADFNISKTASHKFELVYENNVTSYYMDSTKIFEFNNLNMSNGYFSISSFGTYADFRDMGFNDKSTKRYMPYTINTDPCSLRKIDEATIDKDSLYLDNEENKTITQSFIITKAFDYGMLSANLGQEGKNATEIHFWVVNGG